jgi:hypothetical protein
LKIDVHDIKTEARSHFRWLVGIMVGSVISFAIFTNTYINKQTDNIKDIIISDHAATQSQITSHQTLVQRQLDEFQRDSEKRSQEWQAQNEKMNHELQTQREEFRKADDRNYELAIKALERSMERQEPRE